jgi:serine/threonine protein kinase
MRLVEMKRMLRELRLLRLLQHENVIPLSCATCTGPSKHEMGDIYLVTEAMDTDLHNVIRACKRFGNSHILFFFYQLARGLHYVHSAGIIHRDLKPKNLLVSRSCDLRIGDFGMARLREDTNTREMMTEYVCTRWYRSPELLCCWSSYDYKVDIWACGCILVEMFTKDYLFPGKNTLDQIKRISDIVGTPDEDAQAKIPNRKARQYLSQMTKIDAPPLREKLGIEIPAEVEDIVRKMFEWDPDKRLDVPGILEHPYVAELHDPEDEPTREPVPFDLFEYERRNIDSQFLMEELFHELLAHYPALASTYIQRDFDIRKYDRLPYFSPEEPVAQKAAEENDDALEEIYPDPRIVEDNLVDITLGMDASQILN